MNDHADRLVIPHAGSGAVSPLFALLRLALLASVVGVGAAIAKAAASVALAMLAVGGFYAVQRHGGPHRLDRLLALHLCCFMTGAVEVWIALRFTGHPAGFSPAVVLESLTNAVRGAAFPVPGALGVQEGGFIGVGYLLGIAPDTALALSLAHRVPDVVLGLPGLLAWHWLELRNHVRTCRATPGAGARDPRPDAGMTRE